MTQLPIDGIARTLGAQNRRTSLKALALGLAVAGTTPLAAGAKKNKAGKKAKQKCKQQVSPCNAAFEDFCDESMSPGGCRATVAECCAQLKSCKSGPAMECIISAFLVRL